MKNIFFLIIVLLFNSCTIRSSEDGKNISFEVDIDEKELSESLEKVERATLKSTYGCDRLLRNTELEDILDKLESTWLSSNKLDVAKDLIKDQNLCLSTYHVASIIDYIPKSDRFQFARFAYGRTVDHEDFNKIEPYLKENEQQKIRQFYEYKQTKFKSKHQVKKSEEVSVRVERDVEYKQTNEDHNIKMTEKTVTSSCTEQQVISDRDFERLIGYIEEGHMPKDRLSRAKREFRALCLTVAQVQDVMEAIGFPSEQLSFAKYAFSRVIDPKNYCGLKRVLQYSSYKASLTRFCKNKGLNCDQSVMENMMNMMEKM